MDWETLAKILGSAIGLVRQVAKTRGAEAAVNELEKLSAILRAVDHGDISRVDTGAARAELDKLVESLIENDSAADAELARRFAKETHKPCGG